MKQIITLTGEPRSTNNIYKYHCRTGFPTGYMSAEGKALKTDYQWQAKSQWKNKPIPLTHEVIVNMIIFFGTHRKQDIDNYSKIIFDSLTGIVWEDDSQIFVLNTSKFYDKQNPRVELTINEL